MARPIEETPILSKREWKKFEAQLFRDRDKMVTPEEYVEMRKNYESINFVLRENSSKTKNERADGAKHS